MLILHGQFSLLLYLAMCELSDNIYDYHFVSQGKTTIPSVDDGEEMHLADVSAMREWKPH